MSEDDKDVEDEEDRRQEQDRKDDYFWTKIQSLPADVRRRIPFDVGVWPPDPQKRRK